MSPFNETQDYQLQNKGTEQAWCVIDDVCGIEGQNPVKCVQFAIHVKSSSSHVRNTPQPYVAIKQNSRLSLLASNQRY